MTESASTSDTSLFRNLGRALILLRELRGKSQRELAREIGSGAGQLSKYETGKGLPVLPVLDKILRALDLNPLDLFYTMAFIEQRQAALGVGRPIPGEPELQLPVRLVGESAGAALRLAFEGLLGLQAEFVALSLGHSARAATVREASTRDADPGQRFLVEVGEGCSIALLEAITDALDIQPGDLLEGAVVEDGKAIRICPRR